MAKSKSKKAKAAPAPPAQPPVGTIQQRLMPAMPPELEEALRAAHASGRYMVAVWRISEGNGKHTLSLHRTLSKFPRSILPRAMSQLEELDPLVSEGGRK